MKKLFLLIISLALVIVGYIFYYSSSKKNIIDNEILNFKTNTIRLEKTKTDFLDGNYIRCATSNEDNKSNDTIWTDEIKFDFQKIQKKWTEKFPNNILDSVASNEKVGINNLNNIDDHNLYRLIIVSKEVKNNLFSKGISIEQKIYCKKKDTLTEFVSTKEYWWNKYKWELKKRTEYQNLYFKTY